MKRFMSMTALAGGLALGWGSLATTVDAQQLRRIHSEFRYFAEHESNSLAEDGGKDGRLIFGKKLVIPLRWVYVTISATGHGDNGTGLLFTCKVNGKVCQPLGAPSAGATGWVNLQRHADGDEFEDNMVHYTWCAKVDAGASSTVQIWQAASPDAADPSTGTLDAHFYIDNTATACTSLEAGPV
jgi:hypothetical protein